VAAGVYEAIYNTATICVIAGDLSQVVDGISNRIDAAWDIYCRVVAVAVEETVEVAAAVCVIASDLPKVVDGLCDGIDAARRIDYGVRTAAVEKAVKVAAAVYPMPNDLPPVVDAEDDGVSIARGIAGGIDGRDGAVAVEEAVIVRAAVQVHASNLSRGELIALAWASIPPGTSIVEYV